MCTLFLGVLQVQSLASRSIGAERDRETLAVLLTVPISSAEIVSQKLAAASSFRNLLMLPLGVLLLISLLFGTTFLGLWDDGMYSSMGRREKFDQFGLLWGAPISHALLLVIYWQHLTLALRVGAILFADHPNHASVRCAHLFHSGRLLCSAHVSDDVPGNRPGEL
ncbi:MAG UNVERIFIED_CONTAM: ABC transporter permease [Planctomycetaceae bacterium]